MNLVSTLCHLCITSKTKFGKVDKKMIQKCYGLSIKVDTKSLQFLLTLFQFCFKFVTTL